MPKQPPAEQQPTLSPITIEQVRALREQGRLARVEVYPIPEAAAPDAPSPFAAAAVEHSFPGATALAAASQYRFVVEGGAQIPIEGPGVIGRSPDGPNGVTIPDPYRSLSRNHLAFERDARGRVHVADLASANGTEIVSSTGERVECVPQRRYPVGAGDRILIGEFELTVEVY